MSTAPTSTEILADLRDRRVLREPVFHVRDYWRTYGLMVLGGLALLLLGPRIEVTWMLSLVVFFLLANIIVTAVKDTRRVINRRFDLLIAQLEKKGAL